MKKRLLRRLGLSITGGLAAGGAVGAGVGLGFYPPLVAVGLAASIGLGIGLQVRRIVLRLRGAKPSGWLRSLTSDPSSLRIVPVQTSDQIEAARGLFLEYQRFLGVELDFQGFKEEVAGLPGGYAPPGGALLLALHGAEVAGCVALRRLADSICEMKRLYVKPSFRGQGLGRLLAERVTDEAVAMGYVAIRLDTFYRLTEAMKLYESMGFRTISAYNDNPLPGVIYWELALDKRPIGSPAAGAGSDAPGRGEESSASRFLSIIGYIAMVTGVVGLGFAEALFSSSPVVITAQAGAVLLMLWARLTFGLRSFHLTAAPTDGGMVTNGPYRFIRHPIYAAVCVFTWAGAIAAATPLALSLALLATGGALVRLFCEEKLLIRRYPHYRDYAAGTKRLIPFIF